MGTTAVYVNSLTGNDSTAEYNNPNLPFETIQAAYDNFTGTTLFCVLQTFGIYDNIACNKNIKFILVGNNEYMNTIESVTLTAGSNIFQSIKITNLTSGAPSVKVSASLENCQIGSLSVIGYQSFLKFFNVSVSTLIQVENGGALFARFLYSEIDTNIRIAGGGVAKIYFTACLINHQTESVIKTEQNGVIYASFLNCEIFTTHNYIFDVFPQGTYITVESCTLYPSSQLNPRVYLFKFTERVTGTGFFYFQANNMTVQNRLGTQQAVFEFTDDSNPPTLTAGSRYSITLFGFNGITSLVYPAAPTLSDKNLLVIEKDKSSLSLPIKKVIYKAPNNGVGTLTLPPITINNLNITSMTIINSTQNPLKVYPTNAEINLSTSPLLISPSDYKEITFYPSRGWISGAPVVVNILT